MIVGKNIVLIQGHPDANGQHFGHALAEAYCEGAIDSSHQVKVLDVAKMDFPLLRTAEEFQDGHVVDDIKKSQLAIQAADHLVIIYPLWLGTMPALLKAFIEQVFRPGFALSYEEDTWPKQLLTNKTARIIITMGMPALAYRWFYGAHSLKSLERNILKFCGVKPVKDTVIGMVEAMPNSKREWWIRKVNQLGQKGF